MEFYGMSKFICIKSLCLIMFQTTFAYSTLGENMHKNQFSCLEQQAGSKNPCHSAARNLAETTKSCKLQLSVASLVKPQDASCCTLAKPGSL